MTRDAVIPTLLTNFNARIVEEVVEDDGAETRTRLVIEMGVNRRTARVDAT